MSAPDYVKCIAHPHASKKREALCVSALVGFHFTGIEHWWCSSEFGSHMRGCPKCVAEIIRVAESEL